MRSSLLPIVITIVAVFVIALPRSIIAASAAPLQPVRLVDQPTAGTLNKGDYNLGFQFFDEGGVNTAMAVGVTSRFSIGIAWQVLHAIGSGTPSPQTYPGGLVKYRLIEESYYLPGFALGFDCQGAGKFYRNKGADASQFRRFYFKSKGLYAALSKSYLFLGQPLGFHFLANYSVVDNGAESEGPTANGKPSNRIANFSLGLDKSFNEEFAVQAEYDVALDDNHDRDLLQGYLNAGVRWAIVPSFTIELSFKDMLSSKKILNDYQDIQREIRIVYSGKLF